MTLLAATQCHVPPPGRPPIASRTSRALVGGVLVALAGPALHASSIGSGEPPARPLVSAAQEGTHAAQAPRSCFCGHVSGVRLVQAAAGVAQSYEFTVRMRDGSTRMSSSPTVDGWQVGDAVILIGGEPRVGSSPAAAI